MLHVENQIFIQQMIKHQCLSADQGTELLSAIRQQLALRNPEPEDTDASQQPQEIQLTDLDVTRAINDINPHIKAQNLALHRTRCDVTGTKHIALICTINNKITQSQTFYKSAELAFWWPLIDEIIKSPTKSLDKIVCLNLSSNCTEKLSLHDAQLFIDKCLSAGYLVEQEHKYFLGPKTILEFSNEFRTNYQEYVQVCELCSQLCCYGESCVNCNKMMHNHCLEIVLRSSSKCPLCKTVWGEFDFEAQNEQAEEEEEEQPRSRKNAPRSSQRSQRKRRQ